jgi:nicotinamide-nucleotide amidase
MKTEILSIGTEFTSGQNLDTNSQWLSLRLAEIGIPVHFHTTVADDLDDNVDAFRTASRRAGLVIATGGLGPTQDDLTREALARLAGVELSLHQESVDHIRRIFERFRRTMPKRNQVQAMFPTGAEPIVNNHGTAPGIYVRYADCHLFALPGVPTEMFRMFEEQVKPRLQQLGLGGAVVVQRKINCFGWGESAVEEKLLDLTRRGHVPEVGITVSDAVISLRIRARAANTREAQVQIEPVERTIRERLGDLIFGVEQEELQDAVLRLLAEKHKTLTTAESVTGGLVARSMCRVPGASEWFRGGIVAYVDDVKEELLSVPRSLIEEHGVVSGPVAEAMAVGCRTRLHADLAVSTTGIAGPSGGTAEKPVGLVYVGLAWDGGSKAVRFSWLGTRDEVQSRATKMALNLVRLHLLGATT